MVSVVVPSAAAVPTPLVDGKLELLESRSLNVSQFATELPRRLR